jgi:conjugative relaxase-like TrwC/TraI family protein
MLRMIQNTSVEGAKSYYTTADYYTEGQELSGAWQGKGAQRLGLIGHVNKPQWDALCENRHPTTGDKLMPRTPERRRVGYDINFHCPKSVSVLYGLTHDERIVDAVRESVRATMEGMEAEMQTRVRSEGRNEDRTTGNMVWGEFIHYAARPVDGTPDPHLHVHCFTFNTTWDPEEHRWKAGQFGALKRDAPFFEAVFHSYLARRMEELGLETERTAKGWDLKGIPDSVKDKFSRRTQQIEAEAKKKGITDAKAKDELGAKTREHKITDLSMCELQDTWASRLSAEEQRAIDSVQNRIGSRSIPEDEQTTRDAIHKAMDHCFERSAVIPERTLLTQALHNSVGKASPAEIIARMNTQDLIRRDKDGRSYVASWDVLQEENAMLDFAREGRGTCRPLGSANHVPTRKRFSQEQLAAVHHVLTSTDRVILVRGGAGTGKTTMMQEAADGIRAGGHEMFTFAPSAGASRGVLRTDGFKDADTVARLLVDEDLQERARDQVIWIDEAGLLGSRATKRVFDIAKKIDARVVLSGDRRQHSSVERGGTLRLLEDEAGLIPATLRQIHRQEGAYMRVVECLGEGQTQEAFDRLNELGWIKEIGDEDRYQVLADAYLDSSAKPGSTLVVSPTHAESDKITAAIRRGLKEDHRLGETDHQLLKLCHLDLTEPERADAISYQKGDVLVFHQNAKGHKKGSRFIITDSKSAPTDQAARFSVYRPAHIRLATGDRIRITKNWTSPDKSTRLDNGDFRAIAAIDPDKGIVLDGGTTLPLSFGHLDYGYVVTSHASQGKTVDRVIIGQSSESFPASSKEQFYVSVSRGRHGATIFTDDKEALLDAVSHADTRQTATEFLHEREHRERGHLIQRTEQLAPVVAVEASTLGHDHEVMHDR